MTFSQINGNQDAVKALCGMVDSGRIPHALMFHEDDGGGGVAMALAFLQYLYCHSHSGNDSCGVCPSCNKISKLIHPDVHFVFPVTSGSTSVAYSKEWRSLVLDNRNFTESDLNEALGVEGKQTMIAVAEAKAMLESLSLSALEGGYRSVVVYLPEKMNQEAANRLLKVIEEPPSLTQFILVTHSPEKVLQTIRSRCQFIRIVPGRQNAVTGPDFEEFGRLMEALLSKDLVAALDVADQLAVLPSREAARAFCAYSAARLRELFLIQQGLQNLCQPSPESASWASRCKKSFPRTAVSAFDRARMLIERNVNQKILFTDLVDRLYMMI